MSSSALTIDTLTFPGGSSFNFQIPNGKTLTLTNGLTIPAGTFEIQGGGTVKIPSTETVTVNGGTFKTNGTNDTLTQSTTNKGKITNNGSGRWTFSATSGNVDLTGFLFEYLDSAGLNLSGTANLVNLDGGQFVQLENVAGVKAIQLNTSTTVTETTATNVGFSWGAANAACTAPCTPASASSYYVVYAPDCGSQTITFDQWFGDFTTGMGGGDEVNTEDKIHDTDDTGPTCQISMAASASPISLLSLAATPYDSAVSLNWETGSEWDHQGFNVYRSTNPITGYIQVNSSLIRNMFTSNDHHGTYRYNDTDVSNNITYYYKIEDVAFNGNKVLHGPVHANPAAGLGTPPSADPNTSEDSSDPNSGSGNNPTNGPISTPGLVDLGNGIHILAQTDSAIRLEIVPPTETWTTSSWDNTYETVSIPGYSSSLQANYPELPERTVYIEVGAGNTTAAILKETLTESGSVTHKVAPAPSWAPDVNGVLQPNYAIDAIAYAQSGFLPATYYSLNTAIKDISGRKYIEIKVSPILFEASTNSTKKVTKIVLDVGLDGSNWNPIVSDPDLKLSPAAVEGTIRIRYSQTGMYELTYDDLVLAYTEGPVDGIDVSLLRLYYHGVEVPIEIASATGQFLSGDSIRFYAENPRNIEVSEDEVVLSSMALAGETQAALRMQTIDANPTSYPASSQTESRTTVTAEQDNIDYFDVPLGIDHADHFFWKRIWNNPADVGGAGSYLDIPLTLPNLVPSSTDPVKLTVYLRARGTATTFNLTHHLGIYVNGGALAADKSFQEQIRTSFTFDLSAADFVAGANTIRLKTLGDLVPPTEWDLIDIDRVELEYSSLLIANSGTAKIQNTQLFKSLTVGAFSPPGNIRVYDISKREQYSILQNVNVTTPDAGATYEATFATLGIGDGELGDTYALVQDGSFLKPTSLYISPGYNLSLKSSQHIGADMIIVGSRELLDVAQPLIDLREAEGIRVIKAPIDQVYAEFSHGLASIHGIRDLVKFHRDASPSDPPKYLLLLGDSTYDPLDRIGYGRTESLLPAPILNGDYLDYASDNWFVAINPNSDVPVMSVGRIPTSDPVVLANYIKKQLDYEQGSKSQSPQTAKKMVFISDSSDSNENFDRDSQSLAATATSANSALTTQEISKSSIGSDPQTKTAILGAFDEGPLLMTYLGHGAENMWADPTIFTNTDADGLTNNQLPIVMALNCVNNLYYDADPEYASLGEKVLLNKSSGAIAFWGSTTMTIPPVQVAMAKTFINELGAETGQTYHAVRIGDLALKAKVSLGDGSAHRDVLGSWTLFGDPSMKLPNTAFANSTPVTPPEESAPAVERDRGGGGGCGLVIDTNNGPPPPPWYGLLSLFVLLSPFAFLVYLRQKLSFGA